MQYQNDKKACEAKRVSALSLERARGWTRENGLTNRHHGIMPNQTLMWFSLSLCYFQRIPVVVFERHTVWFSIPFGWNKNSANVRTFDGTDFLHINSVHTIHTQTLTHKISTNPNALESHHRFVVVNCLFSAFGKQHFFHVHHKNYRKISVFFIGLFYIE